MNLIIKNCIFLSLIIVIGFKSNAQGFNDEKVSMINFIKRMYIATPFEGVKIIEDYNNKYIVSIQSYEKVKFSSASVIIKLARIKAQSAISIFLNGSKVESNIIIRTSLGQTSDSTTLNTTSEIVHERSLGFVSEIELLTNFDVLEGTRIVFIYFKLL